MRIIDIVKLSLNNDILIAEEEIERLVNDNSLQTEDKAKLIKDNLEKIMVKELSLTKLLSYTNNIEQKE